MMTSDLTQVETELDRHGQLRPLAFSVEGVRVQIVSYGRQWIAQGVRHYLVMDRERRVYELAHHRSEGRWVLVRSPDSFGPRRIRAT